MIILYGYRGHGTGATGGTGGTKFPCSGTDNTGFGYIQGLWYSFYATSHLSLSKVLATAEYSVQVTFSTWQGTNG